MNAFSLHKITVIASDPEAGSMISGWLQLSGFRAELIPAAEVGSTSADEIKSAILVLQGSASAVAAMTNDYGLSGIMAIVPPADVEAIAATRGVDVVQPWPIERPVLMAQVGTLCRLHDAAAAREAMTGVISSMLRVREETLRRFEQLEAQKNLSTRQSQLRGEVLSAIRPALKENIETLSKSIDEGLEQIRSGLQGLRKLDTQLKWLEDEAKELQSPIATNIDTLQISEIEKL